MTDLSSRRVIDHRLHVDNDKVNSGIGYAMIIGRDLIVQLGLMDDFKYQLLQWDDDKVHMKEPRSLLDKSGINKHDMREVFMQSA